MERHEIFDEMLDECFPIVKIAGITFFASDILFECDPIAYRVSLCDWADANCKDGEHENDEGLFCDWCGEKLEDEDA
jgi:hypothetical protein